MIVEPRVVAYINSLDSGNSDICNLIEKEALNDNVPKIGRSTRLNSSHRCTSRMPSSA